MTSIIPLAEIDPQLVEALLDSAFGTDRHDRTAYRLREGMTMLEGLSLAAVDQEKHELLGSIQCWPVALTDEQGKKHPMIMVGPVAVYPDVAGAVGAITAAGPQQPGASLAENRNAWPLDTIASLKLYRGGAGQ